MGLDMKPLIDDLIKGYLKQIIVDGFAHADPHPGNVYLTPNHQIALMDAGMVAKFSNEMQETILKLMIGLSNYDGARVSELLPIINFKIVSCISLLNLATIDRKSTRLNSSHVRISYA